MTILTVGLQLLGWWIGKDAGNKEGMELFYKFVEKIQGLYLKSAHLREDAKRRLNTINAKPFSESP